MVKDGDSSRAKLRKYENDDIPQEKVVRIYQEELTKLMSRRLEESMRRPGSAGEPHPFPGILFPHFFGAGAPEGPGVAGAGGQGGAAAAAAATAAAAAAAGLPLGRSPDDIRLALDTYHRELTKLNMTPMEGLTQSVGLPGLLALQQQALCQQAHAMVRVEGFC